MKLVRMVLAVAFLGMVAGVAYVGQRAESPGVQMAAAAAKFLDSLTPVQKAQATFAYESKERTNWYFTPQQNAKGQATRKGLPLEQMTAEQEKLALELVAAGTSSRGKVQALTIMSLEAILHDLEKKGRMTRNPKWYFFTLFGTPAKTGKWGWRVEGHHLSLNFTMEGTQVVASTPAFFGANPADVKSGAKKGLRILAAAEVLAVKLFKDLDDEQKKIAYQAKQFPEIREGAVDSAVGPPVGLPAAKMTDQQQQILIKLLQAYAQRMPPAIAEVEMKKVRDGGLGKVYFAYQGGTEPGQKHTYRVQGPSFVVEFLNEQADSAGNQANHIHSVWRRIQGDFGIN